MTKYLWIKADTNDADYVEQLTLITDKQLSSFLPLIEAIKHTKGSNFPHHEYVDDNIHEIYDPQFGAELVDKFTDNFCPHGEHGIHNIEFIKILNVESMEKLI